MNNQPIFNHRITGNSNGEDVIDTVSMMANRASSILHLLSLQFGHNEDGHISNAIDSVICEIEDIKVYLRTTKQVG
jgi:hypothetical protein